MKTWPNRHPRLANLTIQALRHSCLFLWLWAAEAVEDSEAEVLALPFLGVVPEENCSDLVGDVVDVVDGERNGKTGEVHVEAEAGPERACVLDPVAAFGDDPRFIVQALHWSAGLSFIEIGENA